MGLFTFADRFNSLDGQKTFDHSSKASAYAGSTNSREKIAVVEAAIYPYRKGRVFFQGSWWPAACEVNVALLPDVNVRVVGRSNITLLVEPLAISALGDC